MLNPALVQTATIIIVTLAALAIAYVILDSIFGKTRGDERKNIISNARVNVSLGPLNETVLNSKRTDQKRKEIQNKLKKQEKDKKNRKITMQHKLLQAGLSISPAIFYVLSLVAGLGVGFFTLIITGNGWVALAAIFVGSVGLPMFIIGHLKKRRQAQFLDEFPNAIDVVVRGVRSGLPLNDAVKMISEEASEPLRSEFILLISEQKMGITIQEGLFRMNNRVELPELNFLAIVITIQQSMGGNLSETLAALSSIIRDRKKMRAKIDAMSMEAKSSAAIIGSLPFLIMLGISAMSPGYLEPMFETKTGNLMLGGSAVWMLCGILVMRQMINMKI